VIARHFLKGGSGWAPSGVVPRRDTVAS
jgi:hypothetical protein